MTPGLATSAQISRPLVRILLNSAEFVGWEKCAVQYSTALVLQSACERPELFKAMRACASLLLLTLVTLSSSL